jgi:tetratricopeptide (TPR) repeat protein
VVFHRFTTRIAIAAVFAGLATAAGAASQDAQRRAGDRAVESARLRTIGLEAGYNLDHEEAVASFRAAIAADPDDPAPHRLLAATLWINALFEQGAVTIDDYLGQARTSAKRMPLSPDVDRAFREHIARATALAEARLRRDPRDADARFQLGAAHSYLASYIGTVEGRGLAALRAGRTAYNEHERVMALDPARRDAGMVVGMYRYGVSTLPLHWRLLAGLAGFGGGRERGLRLVEAAAAHPSDVQTNAMFTLVLIYNREKRHEEALRVVTDLQRRYPRNRLLRLEAASTLLRAGRAPEALQAVRDGLAMLDADRRPRARGEQARWHYVHGAALAGTGRFAAAERELRLALAASPHQWLRGRAHCELGKVADAVGNRRAALSDYRTAVRIGREEEDEAGVEEATKLLRTASRVR